MKNFITLKKEHIKNEMALIEGRAIYFNSLDLEEFEFIFPIERIREIVHFKNRDVDHGYDVKYILFFKDDINIKSLEINRLYLTEEGYNYIKEILNSL